MKVTRSEIEQVTEKRLTWPTEKIRSGYRGRQRIGSEKQAGNTDVAVR